MTKRQLSILAFALASQGCLWTPLLFMRWLPNGIGGVMCLVMWLFSVIFSVYATKGAPLASKVLSLFGFLVLLFGFLATAFTGGAFFVLVIYSLMVYLGTAIALLWE